MDAIGGSSIDGPRETPRIAQALATEVAKVIVGQDEVLELVLTTYFAGGHLLFEGVPGLAKTLMIKVLGAAAGASFSRIQFTPDLLPSDILGTNVYDIGHQEFKFRSGPVFASLVLADEVNRTPPKTQAALLEAMEERHVSVDGTTHPLPADFTVFATQNPVEYEGTYPLPEAQLDRFLLKVLIGYPDEAEERTILKRYDAGFNPHDLAAAGVRKVMAAEHWPTIRSEINHVRVEDGVLDYIMQIVRATRSHRAVALGGSPRAGIALLRGAKALAAIRSKSYITPDEVQTLAPAVLRHRLILTPESELEGGNVDTLIASLLASIPVPR
ncbi:MoxR family ATPase [bacterium]|nr:MoxR family ATPase [bacterium]